MTMIVDEIRNVVLLLSNPSWSDVGTVPTTIVKNITALSNSVSFPTQLSDNIVVLASRYARSANGVIVGFLYVPTLRLGDPCLDESAPHVPDSAVRRQHLPPTNYRLIALAPWTSPRCSKSYLDAAARDPLDGFIFYRPAADTPEDPPPANSRSWNLNDNGKWKQQSRFPIYAVPALAGQNLMFNLSLYSGNMTSVPHGPNISKLYSIDPTDYIRVFTELHVSTTSDLPGLWVYVLIVVGVLLVVITLMSFLMHAVQNRRRASLRRRVRAGQVNLEGMGIKRLTVPMDHIQKFPLFTYHYEPNINSPPATPRSPRHNRTRRDSRGTTSAPGSIVPTIRTSTFSDKPPNSPSAALTVATGYQPVCEICLQQYQNRVTVIRELSCGHIFHPECIDEFLNEVSSLCPLCKACMLPKGYCPKITNTMVRRERAIRRLRDHVIVDDLEEETNEPGRIKSWGSTIKNSIFNINSTKFAFTIHTELQPRTQPAIEKQEGGEGRQPTQQDENDTESPTDLARRRMQDLAGSVPDDGESRLTRWQRIRTRVFPGF